MNSARVPKWSIPRERRLWLCRLDIRIRPSLPAALATQPSNATPPTQWKNLPVSVVSSSANPSRTWNSSISAAKLDSSDPRTTSNPYALSPEDRARQVFLRRPAAGRRDHVGRHFQQPGPAHPAQHEEGRQTRHLHAKGGKAAVGTPQVVSVDASDPRNPIVRIKPVKRLKREKPLAEIREAGVVQEIGRAHV